MDKAAAFVGGLPFGPVCWDKMRDKPIRLPRVYRCISNLIDDNQKDLFDDTDKTAKPD